MILASFSLDWFMTIPGMLITGGVIFLIIALVIFIITGNKKTKTNKEVVAAQDSSKQEAAVVATPAVGQAVTTSEPVVTPQSVVTSESVVPTPPVSSMAEKVAPKEAEPAVFTAPIPQNVAPVPQPFVNNQVPNIAEQSATVPTTPVVNQPVVTEVPVKEEQKETIQTSGVDMPRPIYGGASPIVPNVPHEEEHRPIYGGANPLENTQSVPIVSQRPVVTEEVKVSIPTVEIPTIPVTPNVTPTVAPQATNDIFASNSVSTTPVAPQTVKPTVAVQPAVSQSQTEEIESLF